MTPRPAVETAAGVEAVSALRLPPAEEPPAPLRWGQWVALLAGVVLVVVGVLHLTGASTAVLACAVVGGVAAAVGTGFGPYPRFLDTGCGYAAEGSVAAVVVS